MAVDAVLPGTAVAVFGSTLSLLLNTDHFVQLQGFVPGVSLLPNVWRIGAATSSGARTLDWGKRFADVAPPEFPTGILFLPYLDGARTPFNAPHATGMILGLKSTHGPEGIAQAVQESLGYELALLIEMMEKKMTREKITREKMTEEKVMKERMTGEKVTEETHPFPKILEISGGLSRFTPLVQTVADITGRVLRVHAEDASYGSARIAMTADVPYSKLPPVPPPAKIVNPGKKAECYAPYRRTFIQTCRNLFNQGAYF
jgi:xylulokinase